MIEQIEAIRNEIKRLEEIHERNLDKPMERGRIGYAHGCVDCCDRLLSFIDSLPEPSCPKESDDLEKAAEEYELSIGSQDYCYLDVEDAFKAGAEWQKLKMMEGAVEGYVNYYEDSGGILMAEAQVGCPYHIGDKVRIIIIKDDERTPHNLD